MRFDLVKSADRFKSWSCFLARWRASGMCRPPRRALWSGYRCFLSSRRHSAPPTARGASLLYVFSLRFKRIVLIGLFFQLSLRKLADMKKLAAVQSQPWPLPEPTRKPMKFLTQPPKGRKADREAAKRCVVIPRVADPVANRARIFPGKRPSRPTWRACRRSLPTGAGYAPFALILLRERFY